MKEMTRAQILREFFFRPGIDTLQSFVGELRALTEAEKQELTELAAAELQVVIKAS